MYGSGVAMDTHLRIDPVEEARHREVMDGMGVYDGNWALSKVLEQSDVMGGQNRLLLTKEAVRAGPIPKVFPELEELRADGLNAEHRVNVTVLDTEGRENEVQLRYLNSNKAYRIIGSEWRVFVLATGMSRGDRLDLYTCMRGDGERCIFFFRSQGCDATAWCSNGRKRARQPVRDPVVEDPDVEFFLFKAGRRAHGGNGKHHGGDVDYTREKRDRGRDRKRAKNASHGRRDDHMVFDGLHAWTGGFQADYGHYKAERRREEKAPAWGLLNATPDEREAAKGFLMLRYAIFAGRY